MDSPSELRNDADPPAAEAVAPAPVREAISFQARTGIGLLLVTVAALLLAADSIWDAAFVYAACGIAGVALAMREFADLARRTGAPADRSLLVLGGVALFLLQWAGWASPGVFPDPWVGGCSFLVAILMGLLSSRVLRAEIDGTVQAVSANMVGLLYVPLLLGFLTAARMRWGVVGLITILATCKVGSTGAYFVGTCVGGMPLARVVSPRKTVSGAVGAVVGSVAAAYALTFTPWAMMTAPVACLYGAVVAAAAMLGDLTASLLKRQARVKDSGRLLPGLGGVLDIIDDVLFVAPVSYVFFLCVGRLAPGG